MASGTREDDADGTLRLFVAVDPPSEAKAELRRALRPVVAQRPRLRWTDDGAWHVTLVFLGDVPAATVPALREALGAAAARHAEFHLMLAGTDRFGDRILWAGVDGDVHRLRLLADDVRDAVAGCGLPVEERPFRAHVTLARSSNGDRHGVVPAAAALGGFAGEAWPVDRLRLVGSTYGREAGPVRYSDVASWPLTGTPHVPGR
ncbi:RNA 2',3'-cyclic phosphodiesterase [Yinghuangia aomiensis]